MGIDGSEIKRRRAKTETRTNKKNNLTTCPSCNKSISKMALSCPQCGHQLKDTTEKDKTSSLYGIAGTITLAIGVFCPIISAPIVGSTNFFANGKGDGVALLVFAGLSLVFLFLNKTKLLIYTGVGSLIMLGYTFYRFKSKLNEMSERFNTDLVDNPFRELADMAANSVQMQWGWGILVVAAALLITAGYMDYQE